MKIGFDGITLTIPFPCGTRNYAEQILNALARANTDDEFIVFASKQVQLPDKNFRLVKIPRVLPVMNRQLLLADTVNHEQIDIFHYLGPYGSLRLRHKRMVTTVQDVDLGLTYPYFSKHIVNRIICEITRKIVLQQVKAVIVPTVQIKSELISYLDYHNIPHPLISVIPHGLSEGFERFKSTKKVVKTKSYFLAMGDFAPRKNVFRVVEAYAALPASIRNHHRLKIVCSSTHFSSEFRSYISSKSLQNYVDILENVSLPQLQHLYQHATAFLYPSLYEGFGFPILEAQVCGCPVITSNYGAMKEVAGKAALFVNPLSIDEIQHMMYQVSVDSSLCYQLASLGKINCDQYSWDKSAEKMLNLYRDLL